jgi:hypothetical protein
MKITGTRSYILIELDNGKAVKVHGELTLTPAFYADVASFVNYESPNQDLRISEQEKKDIIKDVLEHNNPEFKIYFD